MLLSNRGTPFSELPVTDVEAFAKSPLFKKMLTEAPHIERELAEFNAEFRALRSRDDNFVGRFLTCHLIVEHFLDDYLAAGFPAMPGLPNVRLTFAQKLDLAAHPQSALFQFTDAVKCLNSVRNKLVHNIHYNPTDADLEPIRRIMDIWNTAREKPLNRRLEMIEDLTLLLCGILSGTTKSMRRRHPNDGLTGFLEWYRS